MSRLLALVVLVLSPAALAQGSGSLAVYVDGLRPGGDVVVRLYRTAEGFPSDRRRAYREVRRRAEATTATVILDDVPVGRLGVVAFHDADGDGRVRLGPNGVPLDGVATANWTGGAAPSWGRSSLAHAGDRVSVVRLRLWYPDGPAER